MNSGLVREFEKLLGPSSVLYRPEDLLLYEYDGSVEKGRPDLVVFPDSTEDVSRIAKFAAKYNLSIVGRAAARDFPAARCLCGSTFGFFFSVPSVLIPSFSFNSQLSTFGLPIPLQRFACSHD